MDTGEVELQFGSYRILIFTSGLFCMDFRKYLAVRDDMIMNGEKGSFRIYD